MERILLTIGKTVVLISDFVKRNRVWAKDEMDEKVDVEGMSELSGLGSCLGFTN